MKRDWHKSAYQILGKMPVAVNIFQNLRKFERYRNGGEDPEREQCASMEEDKSQWRGSAIVRILAEWDYRALHGFQISAVRLDIDIQR